MSTTAAMSEDSEQIELEEGENDGLSVDGTDGASDKSETVGAGPGTEL